MKSKRQSGFTLLELAIVLGMTALISTVMLVNYRQGEKLKRVQLTVDTIVNQMRLAQNYSLTGKQLQRTSGCTINSQQDNSLNYFRVNLLGGATSTPLIGDDKCSNAVTMETQTFLQGVRIKSSSIVLETCNPSCSTSTVNNLYVRFNPPFGAMTASTDGSSYFKFSKADVTIESTDGARTKTFRIDGVSGRIGN